MKYHEEEHRKILPVEEQGQWLFWCILSTFHSRPVDSYRSVEWLLKWHLAKEHWGYSLTEWILNSKFSGYSISLYINSCLNNCLGSESYILLFWDIEISIKAMNTFTHTCQFTYSMKCAVIYCSHWLMRTEYLNQHFRNYTWQGWFSCIEILWAISHFHLYITVDSRTNVK